jgi:hypothetical protein
MDVDERVGAERNPLTASVMAALMMPTSVTRYVSTRRQRSWRFLGTPEPAGASELGVHSSFRGDYFSDD